MKEDLSRVGRYLLSMAAIPALLSAQSPCANVVLPGILQGDSAPIGIFRAMTSVDPDGAGPLPANLVVGGDLGADNIAHWDASANAWSSMGSGIASSVRLLTTMPNGDVVAGVPALSGTQVTDIRRWSGSVWSSLVTSIAGTVSTMHALPNGDLLVGGDFTSIGGVAASNLAVWNGSSWSEFAGGVSGTFGFVSKFGTLANGDLVVAGRFSLAGGVAANNIATWDGTAFSSLGSGLAPGLGPFGALVSVTGLETRANGDLFVCGFFQSAGGVAANNVALWNGTTWSSMGAGLVGLSFYSGWLASADQLPNGDIVVGSAVPTAGNFDGLAYRWDGAAWLQYGSAIGDVGLSILSLPDGLVVGGSELAQFDGSSWQPIDGSGNTTALILAVVKLPTGEVVVGGDITMLNGVAVSNIAMWDGTSWSAMAGGTNNPVRNLVVTPDGDLIATGQFTLAGGAVVNRIARWDGTSWLALGSGTPMPCVAEVLANGDIVVSGESAFSSIGGVPANNVARWDGSAWSAMGNGFPNSSYTYALHAAANGDIYASSYCADPAFPTGSPKVRVLRWDGASWSAVGGAINASVSDVCTLPNGDVVICGKFSQINFVATRKVARWTGAAWSQVGATINGSPFCIEPLPNGDLVMGGWFDQAGGDPGNHLTRWNGSTWLPMGSGADDIVRDMSIAADGNLLLGGSFASVNGIDSPLVAEITTTCPASVVTLGAACSGSGGSNQLAADTLPWTGSTFSMTATGLAPISLIAIDGGLAPLGPVSLVSIGLLQSPPSCMLHIDPTYFELAFTTTGEHSFSWDIPNDPVFGGVNVYWQFVVFEMDAGFSLLETTSTNALELTIGSF